MKTKRACFLLVVVLIFVSVYWNVKPSTTRSHSRNKIAGDREVTLQAGKQASSHDGDKPISKFHTLVQHPFLPTQLDKYRLLRQRLFQLEVQLNESKMTARVIFMGSSDVLMAETPLYKAFLQNNGYSIEEISEEKRNSTQWSGLFCYHTESKHEAKACLSKHEHTRLKLFQKISLFPGLNRLFYSPKRFCYTMLQAQHISVLSHSLLSIPCYMNPSNHKQNLPNEILKSNENGSIFFIQTRNDLIAFTRKKTLLNQRLQNNSILQVISHPLQVEGSPVVIKVYAIITSISPLRIYRHNNGCALIMTLDKMGKIKESWSLEKFKLYLSSHCVDYNPQSVWKHVDMTIVNVLMISESLLSSNDLTRSKNGFQLLEFHFTFNSSLYPFLIKVKSPDPGSTLPGIANDTVSILFTMTSSYAQVTEALYKLKDNFGIQGVYCYKDHSVCLSTKELVFLLEGHREKHTKGGFTKLYPTSDSRAYQALLGELQSSSVGMVTYLHRGTPQLHNVLLLIENGGNQGSDAAVNNHNSKRKERWDTDDEDESADEKRNLSSGHNVSETRLDNCDDDPNTVPVLTDIFINPEGTLNPAFESEIMEYELVFPFSVMMVNLWGKTSTCWSDATVNSKTKAFKEPVNYYLGVGWNEFVIHLLHLTSRPPVVLASYKINIYRQTRNEGKSPFHSQSPHEVCAVKQDCDLKVFPDMPCGPKRLSPNSFTKFKLDSKGLPFCKSGYAPGSWVFPCGKCSQPGSCYWNEASWVPELCQHRRLDTSEVKTCLAKKKILFVGDSTNRGMMYYLMEKINGSLLQWEKTHSMKVYSSALNDDQTSVSFAYFPQFWLPADRKPDFLKALHHLMAKFMPLRNSKDTILVVGGVQWLLPSHVTAIKSTLSSLRLGGIKVIIKTLGSGFNLPVPGFVQVDLEGQMKVSLRNKLLVKTALAAGFDVIDTHVMTISRYKEFLRGNCGCHFHKVVDLSSNPKELIDDKTVQNQESNGFPRYHVIGSINSVYSDIMISRMCS